MLRNLEKDSGRKGSKEYKDTLPWVEKYRPTTLKEIKGHDWIIKSLMNFVKVRKIPHMIFTGPAGTGKTSSAFALAGDLLQSSFIADKILELNASDNVRMATVQNEIKNFTMSLGLTGGADEFRLIILDEADNIPKEPQQALRRIIEKSPSNIRFILMCNYENRLIDPIKSRCALFRFTPLPKKIVIQRLKEIASAENLNYDDEFFEILFDISKGDLRKAVNILQMSSELGIKSKEDYDLVYKVNGFLTPKVFSDLAKTILSGDFMKAISLLKSESRFSSRNLLIQLLEWVDSLDIDDIKKSLINEAIGEVDYRITENAGEELQIETIIGYIIQVLYKTV
ncbi:MAG: replication factor C small subunit [Promethearchaeota archaeon]